MNNNTRGNDLIQSCHNIGSITSSFTMKPKTVFDPVLCYFYGYLTQFCFSKASVNDTIQQIFKYSCYQLTLETISKTSLNIEAVMIKIWTFFTGAILCTALGLTLYLPCEVMSECFLRIIHKNKTIYNLLTRMLFSMVNVTMN